MRGAVIGFPIMIHSRSTIRFNEIFSAVYPGHDFPLTKTKEHAMTATEPSTQPSRKTINVVGAVIVCDGKVLCAQRGEGKSLAGLWEFPGGKIEAHETAREALHREIEEELLCEVEVADEVCTSSYDYDFGTVTLTSFVCHLLNGAPRLTEHQAIQWLDPSEMSGLDWAPADREAVRLISAMDFTKR